MARAQHETSMVNSPARRWGTTPKLALLALLLALLPGVTLASSSNVYCWGEGLLPGRPSAIAS